MNKKDAKPQNILIIGISGGLAQILARIILENHPTWKITGIDSRNTDHVSEMPGLTILSSRYSRGNFEKLFRENEFDTVFHLARMSHSSAKNQGLTERLELSVMGTSRILELCGRFLVKKVIVLSTFHVYGALNDNPIFLKEDAPLRASMKYPELRDVVEMDQICTNWMWKHQNQLSTVVLRPCNIIGNQVQNTFSKFLTGAYAIRPIDFNPIFQFIHEFDMAQVLYRSIQDLPTGIYNVATDDYISLSKALQTVGHSGVPFPMVVAHPLNSLLRLVGKEVPPYLIDYLKNSCLIDNSLLKSALGNNFYRFSIHETLELINLR